MEKLKYVRLNGSDEIIIFPIRINHSEFRGWNVISAGFCIIKENKVECFGESFSLDLKAKPAEDTQLATEQVFGIEAMLDLLN